MSDSIYATLSQLRANLPLALPSCLESIQKKSTRLGRTIVVLDDDPTGTQTVSRVPVLTRWDFDSIAREFKNKTALFFILTNSRSMSAQTAERVNREIGSVLLQASEATGQEFEIVSRSDSTLRGHYPLEVHALSESVGRTGYPQLLIPYFLEGNRFTVHDTHYVVEDDKMIPVASTPFAQDTAFGYTNSNLKDWVEEKTGGTIGRDQVYSVSIETLRSDPAKIVEQLNVLPDHSVCIVNCLDMTDLEAFVDALLESCLGGKKFIYRTAASFVQARAGLAKQDLLSREDLIRQNQSNGGLIVVGSYVPKTTKQLEKLLGTFPNLKAIELAVESLIRPKLALELVEKTIDSINQAIENGDDVVLFTSRVQLKSGDGQTDLKNGNQISSALVQVVSGLQFAPRFLIAKGGITSSDLATKALNVARGNVLGQILPGVPVWKIGAESRYPGMSFVVFPGNVGDDNALASAYDKVR